MDIHRYGIHLAYGRKCLDFGYNPSFYTTPDFDTAYELCHKRRKIWNGQCAILVFQKAPLLQSFKSMEFTQASPPWANLVTISRRCNFRIRNNADAMDIIEGPILSNPDSVLHEGAAPQSDPLRFQYVVKSERAARWFHRKLVGILFLAATRPTPLPTI